MSTTNRPANETNDSAKSVTSKQVRQNGKCRKCGKFHSRLILRITRRIERAWPHAPSASVSYSMTDGTSLTAPKCCGDWLILRAVAGVKSQHECGAKCLESKGFHCECSCGGKNHGASYAVA